MFPLKTETLKKTAKLCGEKGIPIPTFAQMADPEQVPLSIRETLKGLSLHEPHPANLFRISWRNEPVEKGGLYNQGNWMVFPESITGIAAPIVGMVGRYFPTGAHKVGAAFGCLVPRLVTGNFDPETQKAVWPSTGNYCRGGVFDCALLGCGAIAILPEEMSSERFHWLKAMGAEVIATKGCESNVKEIFDECWKIRETRPECVIFNQFEEFGNPFWHYHVTGSFMVELFEKLSNGRGRFAAFVSATGSAGTIGAGDFVKSVFPAARVVAAEARQCPTLYSNGYGDHRIEGIGDKHVPWIHNLRNTDAVCAIDDAQCLALFRLFNEPEGQKILLEEGVATDVVDQLPLLGISSICNLVAAIKTARHFDLTKEDYLFIPLTDSAELYQSRLKEQNETCGTYTRDQAGRDFARYLQGIETDHYRELTYQDRKALHHLKYFTWVEQQGKTVEELNRLWDPDFWEAQYDQLEEWDAAIEAFNREAGFEDA